MNIQKLIERIRAEIRCLGCLLEEAATALSALRAENQKLKDQLYNGEGVNLVNYWIQQVKIEENGHRNCQAENEQLRVELEEVKQKYDEAREAICTHCMDVPCRGKSCYWWRGQKEG